MALEVQPVCSLVYSPLFPSLNPTLRVLNLLVFQFFLLQRVKFTFLEWAAFEFPDPVATAYFLVYLSLYFL